MQGDSRLTLVAAGAGDLATLSALLQDAIVRAGDVGWDRRGRRFVMIASRYRWESSRKTRTRAAFRLESVLSVQQQCWPQDPDTVLNLLAVIADGDTQVTISFAGGTGIRVAVECLDAVLEDLTAAWDVRHTPDHGRD